MYVCGMYAYVYEHAYMGEYMYLHLEAGGRCQVPSCMLSIFYIFETRHPSEPGAHSFVSNSYSVISSHPLSSTLQS